METNSNRPMTIRFKLEVKDYKSYLYFDRYGKDRRFFPTRIAISLILGLLAAYIQNQSLFNILYFLGMSVFFFLIFMVFPVLEITFACQNFMKKDRQGTFKKWQTFRFNQEEIESIDDDGDVVGSFSYEQVYLAAETKSLFLCYFKKKLCIVIPKTYVEAEDYPRLVSLLEREMGNRFVRVYKEAKDNQ